MTKVLKIMGVFIGGFFCLMIVGVIVGVGKMSNDDNKAKGKMDQIHLGMSYDDVVSILGKPSDEQHMDSGGYTEDCYYWGLSNQLCFQNGTLDSKNQY